MVRALCVSTAMRHGGLTSSVWKGRRGHTPTARVRTQRRPLLEDGELRLPANHTPMVIKECYLLGSGQDLMIIGVSPG
jgi:hypothetical protein